MMVLDNLKEAYIHKTKYVLNNTIKTDISFSQKIKEEFEDMLFSKEFSSYPRPTLIKCKTDFESELNKIIMN